MGFDNHTCFELGKCIFMNAVGLGYFVLGTAGKRLNPWVGRVDGGGGCAGESAIALVADNKKKVTVTTGAKRAVDGAGIFEDFFIKEGESCMVGFAFVGAVELGKGGVGKGGDDVAHGVLLVRWS